MKSRGVDSEFLGGRQRSLALSLLGGSVPHRLHWRLRRGFPQSAFSKHDFVSYKRLGENREVKTISPIAVTADGLLADRVGGTATAARPCTTWHMAARRSNRGRRP